MGNPHRDRDRRKKRDDGFGNRMTDAFARYGKIDVSVEKPRPRDDHNQNRSTSASQRPRLEFTEMICLEQGECRCRVTVAQGFHGKVYNFSVERQNRDRGSRFFREHDVHDLIGVIQNAKEYIEAQKNT